jgi:hypothetical protein
MSRCRWSMIALSGMPRASIRSNKGMDHCSPEREAGNELAPAETSRRRRVQRPRRRGGRRRCGLLRGGCRGLGVIGRRRGEWIGKGGVCDCDKAGESNCGKDRAEHVISPVRADQAGKIDGPNLGLRHPYETLHTLESGRRPLAADMARRMINGSEPWTDRD